MTEPVKRPYRSRARAENAEQTRARLREAAAALFLEVGYASTSLREVARRAGVGERTLYDAFASKAALFEHVVGVAIVGDELPVPVHGRDDYLAALSEGDGRRAVDMFAGYAAALLERAGPLIMVAVESAGADEAMRSFADAGARQTAQNTAAFVHHLVELGLLDVREEEQAAAGTLALCSPHVHSIHRRDAGRTAAQYRAWLGDASSQRCSAAPPDRHPLRRERPRRGPRGSLATSAVLCWCCEHRPQPDTKGRPSICAHVRRARLYVHAALDG
jgi:AcrR family transcriptional regulator